MMTAEKPDPKKALDDAWKAREGAEPGTPEYDRKEEAIQDTFGKFLTDLANEETAKKQNKPE